MGWLDRVRFYFLVRFVGHENEIESSCQEWERYDGEECACATGTVEEVCSPGGQVCDNTGAVHSSMCAFALEMCQGHLTITTQLHTCGMYFQIFK